MTSTLRIAYLCDHSPLNRNLYSGGNARIHDALQRHAGEVTILSEGWGGAEPLRKLLHAMPDSVNLRARWRMHLALSRMIARNVRTQLAQQDYDVIFCAYAFHALRHVVPTGDIVSVYSSDATPTTYRTSEIGQSYKPKFWGGRSLDAWVERCESQVFGATDLMLWPSSWLKDSVEARYDLKPGTSHMVPWGANLDSVPPASPKALTGDAPVQLLLVGRDWFAKGGPLAYETMHALRSENIDARLTVIGCQPPDFHVDPWVTVHSQLDKSKPDELALFNAAFAQAHFMVQPSYESYGFAFCEASAHGLPSLCLRVGGVPIVDGRNGHALPAGSDAAAFARMVRSYLETPDAYHRLSQSTRAEFDSHLNWDAWGAKATELMHDAVARKRATA